MKDYFNQKERDTHIIILFMAEIVGQFKDCTSLSEEEQELLSEAEECLRQFTESIYARFGDAYKRKIKGTLEINTVRVGSKYGQDKVYSYYDGQDQMVNLMLSQVQRPQTYETLSRLHTVDSEVAYSSRNLDLHTSSLGFLFFLSFCCL